MNGIDVLKLDEFIKKNDNIFDSLNTNSKRVVSTLKELDDCYDGKALNSIYSTFCTQGSKFDSINSILDNYLLLLKSVRKNYVLQDMSLSQYIQNMENKQGK